MAAPAGRLVSLDAFRGLTIASMILVNNPGTWSAIYWPLGHAAWHGWTPTDLIFPFFLFMVGMSINFSRKTSAREALRRAAVLFGLGVFMAAYPFFDLTTVRIPGVLQRIALCYLATWWLRRLAGTVGQAVTAALLLVGYWAAMTFVPVPGGVPPNLLPETNLGAWLDQQLLAGHMWKQSKVWDPEGLFSTLPAIGTTILGLLAGEWLKSERSPRVKVAGLLAGGIVLTVAGIAWGESFPINKALWTSSYVLLSGGLAACAFGLCYLVADLFGWRGWTGPFVIYGTNAIVVFVASGLLAKTIGLIQISGVSLQALIYQGAFESWLTSYNASLGFALATVLFWFLVLAWMDARGIHVRV
jgi:predicted acyltransferase